ncbi:unnamed protein product [Prunus armeniaca]|uniref:Uncharacterized protein n=1 Tax=Prunus armeniaca TaxID=36596 RepID=A0A6J5WFX1_PRUAR|nr:unnamed protein product [Prunus armeniaca]
MAWRKASQHPDVEWGSAGARTLISSGGWEGKQDGVKDIFFSGGLESDGGKVGGHQGGGGRTGVIAVDGRVSCSVLGTGESTERGVNAL